MDESCDLLLEAAAERKRVERGDVAAAGSDEVAEESRERLLERVVGPDEEEGEEEEGADEVASARFRLRVSIQNPKPPAYLGIQLRSNPNRSPIY